LRYWATDILTYRFEEDYNIDLKDLLNVHYIHLQWRFGKRQGNTDERNGLQGVIASGKRLNNWPVEETSLLNVTKWKLC
jgi:hypothetical protein